jgi:hypothetical protein
MEKCCLCKSNPADKKNSHILPKFITKDILSEIPKVHNIEFKVGSGSVLYDTLQDTTKEDDILCTDCEQYFGKLEREFANQVHNSLRDATPSSQQVIKKTSDNGTWKEFELANKTLCSLLIYSIIFRCHVSMQGPFSSWKLPETDNEKLRLELLKYRFSKRKEIVLEAEKTKLSCMIDFSLFVCEQHDKSISNLLSARRPPNPDDYYLILGEYRLIFSFQNKQGQEFANGCNNPYLNIVFIPNEKWKSIYEQDRQNIIRLI